MLLVVILMYPVFLGAIYAFNVSPFFITAPYFFLINILLFVKIIQKSSIHIPKDKITDVLLCLCMLGIALFNYSSLRYSLPIFFAFYLFIFQLYTVFIRSDPYDKIIKSFTYIYIILSLIFYFSFD